MMAIFKHNITLDILKKKISNKTLKYYDCTFKCKENQKMR